MNFDYVICGGGSAGATLAARLSEDPSITVCLLEAGGESHKNIGINVPAMLPLAISSKKTNWQFETTPQPGLNGRRGYQPRGKTLGGSSAINGMIYIRGHRKDYDNWAEMGCQGWSYEDVLPYFLKSENNVRGASEYHGGNGPLHVNDTPYTTQISDYFQKSCEAQQIPRNPDFNAGDNTGVGQYQVTQFHSKTDSNHGRGRRSSAAEAFLQPVRDTRKNLTIITHVRVAKVEFEGKRASGVRYHQDRVEKLVSAGREVILCAGAFGSPQILQLSGIGNETELSSFGIDVVHNNPNVGLNLHDHIDLLHGYKVNDKSAFGLTPGALLKAIRAIGEYRKNGTGFFSTQFTEVGAFLSLGDEHDWPDVQLHFITIFAPDHGRKLTAGYGVGCHVCILRPKSRGSVKLASNDPFDAPLINPNFLGEEADMKLLLKGVKKVREIMATSPISETIIKDLVPGAHNTTDDQLRDVIRNKADTVYHPVGTCRMGVDKDAVVDTELRVIGVENLRVVDASIMPQVISGNTNAPSIMIAEKAADLIKASAKS